jgi:hypothetical protein
MGLHFVMKKTACRCLFVASILVMATIAGCSSKPANMPALAPVTGTVTMDGTPLANVLVLLRSEKGAVSMGVTDSSGSYHAKYLSRFAGAALGKTTVEITGLPKSADDPTPTVAVPTKYNTATSLSMDVQKGMNKFDFQLTSQ